VNFKVIETADTSQTAWMTLKAGESSGPKCNEHAQSEQVLYLVQGTLDAEIGERRFTMKPGDSVIVGKNVNHRFTNSGTEPAVTFNVYAPPAY
jgi:mannose-6-phosphate isomerase-like protein (cupin superfamily)